MIYKKFTGTLLYMCLLVALAVSYAFMAKPNNSKDTFELAINYKPVSVKNVDTAAIYIPFRVNFSALSEEYRAMTVDAIQSFYHQNISAPDFSGSFLVAKNGIILYESYQGYSDRAKKNKIDSQTSIHVASVSKVMTSAAILRLVDQNKLTLDDKVVDHLEGFPYHEITVRMLLNHRSGLQHYSRFGELIKGWNHKKALTNQDVLETFNKHKLRPMFKPNAQFNYNNSNYALLALIVEKVYEMPFQEAMQKLVFSPLGMDNTFVIDFESQKSQVCLSYQADGKLFEWSPFEAIYGDKNVYTTPRDLVKFDMATYSDEFLPTHLKEEMLTGYSYEKNGINNYGLGIRMKEFKTGQKIHYHNGWWRGNTSSFVTLKQDTVTIVTLSNRYSKCPYQSMKLAKLFNDYPLD